jgi:hypothetical protein
MAQASTINHPTHDISHENIQVSTLLDTASTACRATPQLAHINFEIGHSHTSKYIRIKALHDSGCAASIIKKSIFDLIPNSHDIEIIPKPNTFVVSVTGEKTPIYGSAILALKFTGSNDVTLTFHHEIHIHDNVEHDFLLGRDFTGSNAKLFETKEHMYLTKETEFTDIEDFWQRAKHTSCHVPIWSNPCKTYEIQTTDTIMIPPQTLYNVPCHYTNSQTTPTPVTNGQPVSFEITNVLQPRLQHLHALYTYTHPDEIYVPIFNHSFQDYIIEKHIPIAHIHIWDETPELHTLHITTSNIRNISINHAHIQTAERINADEILTEDEKLENFYQFIEKGSYPIPMSTLIENSPSITEMSLKNTTPFSDADFDKQFSLSHLSLDAQRYALQIFHTHKQVFSRHDYDIGCAKDIEMTIDIDETKPRIQKYVPLPHAVRSSVRQILDQMIEFGIIRECNEASPFCSNLLVTRKKDKKQIRVLLDGRLLNSATKRYPVNMVSQPEVLAHIAGNKFITTMDVSHAFFQVPVAESSQNLTVFYSEEHGKRYCFRRCPQGLKNSPLFLKLLMDKLLGDLAKYVIHYVDDILIATNLDIKHHLDIVEKVLHRLHTGGLKLRPDKIHIATDTVDFLGVVWNKGKLHIPEARVLAFKNYPRPTTPRKVKSFVCAMSYYRRFIPKFANLAQPLMELTTLHPKQFKWTQQHDTAFTTLIQALIDNTSLNLPDPDKPFYVQSDASEYCGAGRVFQKDKDGNELLLACVSRTFTRTERKYGIFRKETLALLYCLKSMDYFLRFAKQVILLVDAKSIIFLRMCKDSAGILLRFSLELSKYDAEIYHVPGTENEISDILSREHASLTQIITEQKNRHILTETQTEQILKRLSIPDGRHFTADEVTYLLEADSIDDPTKIGLKKPGSKGKLGARPVKNTPKTLGERKVKMPREDNYRTTGVVLPQIHTKILHANSTTISYTDFKHATRMITSGQLSAKMLIQAQHEDPQIGQILRLSHLPKQFKLIDDILYHIKYNHYRLALPAAFLDPIIHSKHYTAMGLHFSKTRIARDIYRKFFTNTRILKQKLDTLKQNCLICQFNNNSPSQHPLQQSNLIFAPRVTWACDIIPSMPESQKGHTAIFLAVDMFTGYVTLAPLKQRTTVDIINAILTSIIQPFTTPKYFRCDSETAMFSSKDFYSFMEPLGIKFLPCSIGAPWSNGAAERAVQTIKLGLRKFVQQEHFHKNWDDYLHFYSSAHNKSTSVYGYEPEALHFGFTNPSPNELFQLWPNSENPHEYITHIVPIAEKARQDTFNKRQKAMASQLTYRNKDKSSKTFKLGQVVLQRVLQLATGPGKSLQPSYTGPYTIVELDPDGSSALIEHLHTSTQVRAHFSNLEHLNYLPNYQKHPDNYDQQFLQFLPEKFSVDKYYDKPKTKQTHTKPPTPKRTKPHQIHVTIPPHVLNNTSNTPINIHDYTNTPNTDNSPDTTLLRRSTRTKKPPDKLLY